MLRDSKIGGMVFERVIGVGHSLGAAVTQGLSRVYTTDLDAVILTGHSGFHGGSGTGFATAAEQIANTSPDRPELKGLAKGYFTLGPVTQTLHFAFYYYPYFDENSKSLSVRSVPNKLFTLTPHSLCPKLPNPPNKRHRRDPDSRLSLCSLFLLHQTRTRSKWLARLLLLPG
jgi:hypothetical protein